MESLKLLNLENKASTIPPTTTGNDNSSSSSSSTTTTTGSHLFEIERENQRQRHLFSVSFNLLYCLTVFNSF
jgi:hypothetical protein